MTNFYYRVLLRMDENTTFDALSLTQQEAIGRVLGQYRLPMPGTVAVLGKVICDCIAADNFDPSVMDDLGLADWEIIGMWKSDGTVIVPLDEVKFLAHLPLLDDLSVPLVYEPHRWAGWPQLF